MKSTFGATRLPRQSSTDVEMTPILDDRSDIWHLDREQRIEFHALPGIAARIADEPRGAAPEIHRAMRVARDDVVGSEALDQRRPIRGVCGRKKATIHRSLIERFGDQAVMAN